MNSATAPLKALPARQPFLFLVLAATDWMALYQALSPASEALVADLPVDRASHLVRGYRCGRDYWAPADGGLSGKYGVMSTPGVVINGKVVHAGGVPSRDKIAQWFTGHTA